MTIGINTLELFKYRRLSVSVLASLAASDYHEDRGDIQKAEEYTREAIAAEEEREDILSKLNNVEIGILMKEEARSETKVKLR